MGGCGRSVDEKTHDDTDKKKKKSSCFQGSYYLSKVLLSAVEKSHFSGVSEKNSGENKFESKQMLK